MPPQTTTSYSYTCFCSCTRPPNHILHQALQRRQRFDLPVRSAVDLRGVHLWRHLDSSNRHKLLAHMYLTLHRHTKHFLFQVLQCHEPLDFPVRRVVVVRGVRRRRHLAHIHLHLLFHSLLKTLSLSNHYSATSSLILPYSG